MSAWSWMGKTKGRWKVCECQSCEEILGKYPEKQISLTLKFCTVFFGSYNFPFEVLSTVEDQAVHHDSEDEFKSFVWEIKIEEKMQIDRKYAQHLQKVVGCDPSFSLFGGGQKGHSLLEVNLPCCHRAGSTRESSFPFSTRGKECWRKKRTGNSGVNSVMGCWIRTVGNPVFSCISEVAHEYILSWILLKWGVLCSWILFHLVGPTSKPTRLYFGLMSTLLGYHQVYSGVVRSAEGLMSPSVVLLAWTSPGPQEHHLKAAAQLDSVAVKELCFL